MGEWPHLDQITIVHAGDGGNLDNPSEGFRRRLGADAVALATATDGCRDFARQFDGRNRPDNAGFAKADGRLQRAADQHDGEHSGENRSCKPAQADTPPVRRPLPQAPDI